LTDGTVPASAPNGKVYFTSIKSGNDEVWSMNADGSEPRQLTSDPADDEGPIPSPDGKTIYFSSNRTGEVQIWRMDPDGGDQRPITTVDAGFPKFATLDGRYLYYQHAIVGTLWRLDLASGQVTEAMTGVRGPYGFSPDGTKLVCLDGGFDAQVLKLISFPDGGVIYSVEVPRPKFRVEDVTWRHDARAFYYVLFQNEGRRSLLYRRQLNDPATQVEVADLGSDDLFEVHSFEITPDDKSFVLSQGSWKHDAVLIGGLK
jgi:Tol biopolymer transport system component